MEAKPSDRPFSGRSLLSMMFYHLLHLIADGLGSPGMPGVQPLFLNKLSFRIDRLIPGQFLNQKSHRLSTPPVNT